MFGIKKQNRLRNGKSPQLKVFFYKNLDNLQNFKFLENLIKISCFNDVKNSWIDKKAYEVYRTKNLPNLKVFFFANTRSGDTLRARAILKFCKGMVFSFPIFLGVQAWAPQSSSAFFGSLRNPTLQMKIGWHEIKTCSFGSAKWFWPNIFAQSFCLMEHG